MEAYISMITAFGCTFVIRNWGACTGGLVPISQNNALFSLLGTNFGGDGRTTFGLPDLRGRSPVNHGAGTGLSPVAIGQKGGVEYVTLTSANLPAHYHSVNLTGATTAATGQLIVSTGNASTNDPDGNYLATTAPTTRIYTDTLSTPAGSQDAVAIPAQPVSVSGNTGSTGNSIETYTRSPYQGVNYQICMFGLYPPRN
jgi:microcystin-dependent protein